MIEINSERWLSLNSLPNEKFKDIKGFEGLYQISNYGRVKSLSRIYNQFDGYSFSKHEYRERILKCCFHKQGYVLVQLSKDCRKYFKQVHRLVAQAFLKNYSEDLEVNHKNAIKSDNNINNLEMVTRLENQNHAERNNLIKRIKGKGNHSNKAIVEFTKDGKLVEYYSLTNASEINDINIKHLSYCLRKNRKDKYKQSIWKYKYKKDNETLHK